MNEVTEGLLDIILVIAGFIVFYGLVRLFMKPFKKKLKGGRRKNESPSTK